MTEFEKIKQSVFIDTGFIEKKKVRVSKTREEYIAVGYIKREEVLLKIISSANQRSELLINELIASKALGVLEDDLGSRASFSKTVNYGSGKGTVWLIRKYYKGDSLAHYSLKNRPLLGYDVVRNKYRRQLPEMVKVLSSALIAVQSVTPDNCAQHDKLSYFRRFPKELSSSIIGDLGSQLGIDVLRLTDYFRSNSKLYFNKSTISLSLGDMVPSNVIIEHSGRIIISDFEWIGFDNKTIDVAFLWLFLWRHKNAQKKLIETVLKNSNDKRDFRLSVIREIYYWYLGGIVNVDKKLAEKRRHFFSQHIWTKYFTAAGESFEALMNVK